MAQGRKVSHCHKAVAKVAKTAAAESYEELMKDNLLFDRWKKANPDLVNGPSYDDKRLRYRFVMKNWSKYIDFARATMALLLRQPIDDKTKEEIVEILALDATLIRGRKQPALVVGEVKQTN